MRKQGPSAMGVFAHAAELLYTPQLHFKLKQWWLVCFWWLFSTCYPGPVYNSLRKLLSGVPAQQIILQRIQGKQVVRVDSSFCWSACVDLMCPNANIVDSNTKKELPSLQIGCRLLAPCPACCVLYPGSTLEYFQVWECVSKQGLSFFDARVWTENCRERPHLVCETFSCIEENFQ